MSSKAFMTSKASPTPRHRSVPLHTSAAANPSENPSAPEIQTERRQQPEKFSGQTPSSSLSSDAHRADLPNELRRAKQDEIAWEKHLHRLHDPNGLQMLRSLRARIAALQSRLGID